MGTVNSGIWEGAPSSLLAGPHPDHGSECSAPGPLPAPHVMRSVRARGSLTLPPRTDSLGETRLRIRRGCTRNVSAPAKRSLHSTNSPCSRLSPASTGDRDERTFCEGQRNVRPPQASGLSSAVESRKAQPARPRPGSGSSRKQAAGQTWPSLNGPGIWALGRQTVACQKPGEAQVPPWPGPHGLADICGATSAGFGGAATGFHQGLATQLSLDMA